METPYKIDSDQLGDTYCGTTVEIPEFIKILAEITGEDEDAYAVEAHCGQDEDAIVPSDRDWMRALDVWSARRPELWRDSGPTNVQLWALRREAGEYGDLGQVELCTRALAGDVDAIEECRAVIISAASTR